MAPATAMLFLPPRPPLQVPAEGTLLIGRSSAAALCLSDVDTSRRHAEIVCRDGVCTLRDLESTNGTWVNGERIETRELRPGDRIEIGDNQITFCEVDAEIEAEGNDSTATFFREQPTPARRGESFRGDLAEIPPYAVLQILELGHKTGELRLEGEFEGCIWLQRGDPVHAETKDQLGFDAALALVGAASGRFEFVPALETPEPTIDASVTQLLLEASRLLDEQAAG